MFIRYTIVLDDLKAYHDTIRSALPYFVKFRLIQSLGGPLCLLFLVWLLTNFEHGWWPTLVGVVPAGVLGLYLWRESPGLWKRANLDAMYREGKLDGHVGQHSLELREDGVLERNAAGEHLSHWAQLENIYSTPQCTFFVTKTQLGYVLPKSSIVEGSYEAFVERAIAEWKKHGG